MRQRERKTLPHKMRRLKPKLKVKVKVKVKVMLKVKRVRDATQIYMRAFVSGCCCCFLRLCGHSLRVCVLLVVVVAAEGRAAAAASCSCFVALFLS